MSRDCWVESILFVPPSYETIHKILDRGSSLGFIYDNRLQENISSREAWNTCEAAQWLINAIQQEQQCLPNTKMPFLIFTYQASSYELSFDAAKTFLRISLGPASDTCWKGDSSYRCFDFAHYMRLLLDLCEDFVITNLSTYDSYDDELDDFEIVRRLTRDKS